MQGVLGGTRRSGSSVGIEPGSEERGSRGQRTGQGRMHTGKDDREAKCSRAVELLRAAFGENLRAIILYGSAAGADYVPGRSDINLLVVLHRARPQELHPLRAQGKAWHGAGLAVPLVVDGEFLVRAADVFPLELSEIREQHRLLFGEPVLDALEVRLHNLRHQVEFELRSKALRLTALYLEADVDRQVLEEALLGSVKSFAVLMKQLLRLVGETGPLPSFAEVVERFASRFSLPLPAVRLLLAIRTGASRWPADIAALMQDYLADIQAVIHVADTAAERGTGD